MAVKYMHLTARGFSPSGHSHRRRSYSATGSLHSWTSPPRDPLPIHRTAGVVLRELQNVVVVLAQHVPHPSRSSVRASKRSAPLIFSGTSSSPTGYTSQDLV